MSTVTYWLQDGSDTPQIVRPFVTDKGNRTLCGGHLIRFDDTTGTLAHVRSIENGFSRARRSPIQAIGVLAANLRARSSRHE